MRSDTRESFASSISRLRGAERLAEQDARRKVELDSLIARHAEVTLTHDQRLRKKARRAREALRKVPRTSAVPRLATIATAPGWDKGGGI